LIHRRYIACISKCSMKKVFYENVLTRAIKVGICLEG